MKKPEFKNYINITQYINFPFKNEKAENKKKYIHLTNYIQE